MRKGHRGASAEFRAAYLAVEKQSFNSIAVAKEDLPNLTRVGSPGTLAQLALVSAEEELIGFTRQISIFEEAARQVPFFRYIAYCRKRGVYG